MKTYKKILFFLFSFNLCSMQIDYLKIYNDFYNNKDLNEEQNRQLGLLKDALSFYGQESFYECGCPTIFSNISYEEREKLREETNNLDQKALDAYNFFMNFNAKKFNYFANLFYIKNCINEQEKNMLIEINQKIKEHKNYTSSDDGSYFLEIFTTNLPSLKEKLLKFINQNQTIVLVGNTPQYIRPVLEHMFTDLNIISVAISGWPGEVKWRDDWYEAMITPKGIENYKNYIKAIFDIENKEHKNFVFIDIVSGGNAIRYIENTLNEIYQEKNLVVPNFIVMAINQTDKANISLGMNLLANMMDRVVDQLRIMPQFNSWKWEDWIDGPEYTINPKPITQTGKNILDKIKEM